MSTSSTTTELRRMTIQELRQEIALHTAEYGKMRMGIEMQKEKNHALYKSKRREIATMQTVLTEMEKNPVQPAKSSTTSEPVKELKTEKPKNKASQTVKKPVKVPRSK